MNIFSYLHSLATCGRDYHSTNGELRSPNYPSNYDSNLDCYWTITVPYGRVRLNILDLVTEMCDIDFLKVSQPLDCINYNL